MGRFDLISSIVHQSQVQDFVEQQLGSFGHGEDEVRDSSST